MRPPAGIYLHWPFCERKCPYCDFYTFGREHSASQQQEAYASALAAQIETQLSAASQSSLPAMPPAIDSVYFGGGTPSLMGPAVPERLLAALSARFAFAPDTEITLEVNPTTAESAQIGRLLALGVNRLSIGCQSFNDRLLAQLGRVHDSATTRRALAHLRDAGATNMSLDIIFGVPTQSHDDLERDIDALLSFNPEHISAYGLTLHEGTPFYRWAREGRIAPPGDDAQATMYERLLQRFAGAGYEHYEISNWARTNINGPSLRSRHNQKYWRDCDVYAFGTSAHGVMRGKRFENPRDLKAYIAAHGALPPQALDAPTTQRARGGEIMMLALRRLDGAAWRELDAWFGDDMRVFYAAELREQAVRGNLAYDPDGVRLTRSGLLIADTVFESFF